MNQSPTDMGRSDASRATGHDRKVHTAPPDHPRWLVRILGAVVMTFAIFLVLPLTQMVSSYSKRELLVTKVETTTLEAPPDVEDLPPPPEEEPPPEEPEPELSDAPQTMDFNIDLDMAVGSGGALPGGMGGLGISELGEAMSQALDVADLDKTPTLVAAVPPRYPPELRRAKIEGTVSIVFVLSEKGRVEDPRVESSTRAEFEKPALDAVKRWRFKPGEKDGVPVRTYLRQPISFRAG